MGQAGLVVLYGGTFDPVHNGHLAIARAARQKLGCAIRMMPAADPPHRPPPGASADERAAMLELAVADEPGLCVDRRELERTGASYTVDTLRQLRAVQPDVSVALLLGADSFISLPGWKDWRDLFDLAHFVVAARPGQDSVLDPLPEPLASAVQDRWVDAVDALTATPAGKVLRLGQPLHDVSATGLRGRIASGAPWKHLLPAPVAARIQARGLYRDAADTASSL